MRSTIHISPLLLVLLSNLAHALSVFPGCAEPAISSHHRNFYVDPERGNKANDGSADRPWRTLAEVLDPANHLVATESYLNYLTGDRSLSAINPEGPIKPGDVIYLKSGDHGSPILTGYSNGDFITVEAALDQKPVVERLTIAGASHWIFRGIKFMGSPAAGTPGWEPLVYVGLNSRWGPTENIIFDSNTITTEDDASSWSNADWVKRPYYSGLSTRAVCTAITNNHFVNVRNAIGLEASAQYTLVQGNIIERFGNDGIDVTASDVMIRKNIIRYGHHTPSEPLHADAIQGWTAKDKTNRNVTIDSNLIINTPRYGDYLQGISIFDGKWDGLVVSNNAVITNSWHGIALYGVANALVINNTVVPSGGEKVRTWIMIHDSKDGTRSRNVVVRNNISPQIVANGDGLAVDHNITERAIGAQFGAVNFKNIVDPYFLANFVNVDILGDSFDLHPRSNGPAIKSGSSDEAPLVDLAGETRTIPIDVGAYARSPSKNELK